jgi:hypothetical protein
MSYVSLRETGWKSFTAIAPGNTLFASMTNIVFASAGMTATPIKSKLSTITNTFYRYGVAHGS